MAEELGKIEKPSVEEFKSGRKLYFVPLVFRGKESPADYLEKFNKYWDQVGNQVSELVFFFQAEDGIRDSVASRGLGDVYKRQCISRVADCGICR